MTDLESFIATYKQFGIDVKTTDLDDCIIIILHAQTNYDYDTNSDKFGGHSSVHSELNFTKEGKFIDQNFWVEYD